jgi:hypothetical protein
MQTDSPQRLSFASSRLSSWWRVVPGKNGGAKGLWLWHLVALLALIIFLKEAKAPWELKLGGPVSASLFKYGFTVGLWWGAVAHAAMSLLLLATVRFWGSEGASDQPPINAPAPPLRWGFWLALALILAGALWLRLPRMNLSYWGDEGWAARYYSHGNWKPAKGKTYQDKLTFEKVDWRKTLWDDHTGGNHYFFSAVDRLTLDTWRALRGLPDHAFSEAVSRLPPLLAGLASLVAMALFLAWLGYARAGLLAALLLALHPWHLRYSTEARGYTLMLLFFILTVWALMDGIRGTYRWRGWLLFALASFLAAWSWKLAVIPLLAVNAIFVILLAVGAACPAQAQGIVFKRWLVAGLTAGALFVFLAGPGIAQSPYVTEDLRNSGEPMDALWVRKSLSGMVFGAPWDREDPLNPHETPVQEQWRARPLLTSFALGAEVLMLAAGAWMLARRQLLLGLAMVAVLLSALAGAWLFKTVLRVEWIYWYSFFVMLPVMLFKSAALDGWMCMIKRRTALPALAALVLVFPGVSWGVSAPQIRFLHTHSYENMRAAFHLSRGKHEPWGYAGPSKVYTCYLWRHLSLYDPRGNIHVRTGAQLRALIAEVDRVNGELYYIIGQRSLCLSMNPDLMEVVHDPRLFEKQATSWAERAIFTLEVYHYRKPGSRGAP